MRALIVHPGPDFSVADVYHGWVRGFHDLGVETAGYNLDDRLEFYTKALLNRDGEIVKALGLDEACHLAVKGLEAACYEFWPDVVVVISGFFLDEFVCNVMRARGHKLVLVHTESPYEDDRQSELAKLADLNVLNDPTNLDRYPAGTVYLPHCYDPHIHHPRSATRGLESEFCFVGTGFQSRIEFFEQVDFNGIHAVLAGHWSGLSDDSPLIPLLANDKNVCCENRETVLRYTSTLASANLYRREAQRPELSDGWAMGPREVELAACGTFFLRDPRGEGDEVLPMLPTFAGPQDFADKLRWWLNHPAKRDTAAQKAREAISDRTFDTNAAETLRLLGL